MTAKSTTTRYHIEMCGLMLRGQWDRLAGSTFDTYHEVLDHATRISPQGEQKRHYRIVRVEVTTAKDIETDFMC